MSRQGKDNVICKQGITKVCEHVQKFLKKKHPKKLAVQELKKESEIFAPPRKPKEVKNVNQVGVR